MNDSAYRVETICRLAQWRIDNLASCTYCKSDPFTIAIWNWHLCVEKIRVSCVKLFPEATNNLPLSFFVIRLLSFVKDRKALAQLEVRDKLLSSREEFVWGIEVLLPGRFIIHVEFFDLKTSSSNVSCMLLLESLLLLLLYCSSLSFYQIYN
ncbi:hypothetical protein S245_022378 [Arachis hypogaea]